MSALPIRNFVHLVPAALLGLAVIGCAGESVRVPADASPFVRAAVEECAGLAGASKTECYQGHFLARLADTGVREALSGLEAVAAIDVDVERDGHVYTHAIGITSYSPDVDVSAVFSQCTTLFQSGCYHGVLQAYFMASGELTDELVQGLCEQYKGPDGDRWVLFQCLHGMGHGLTMFYDHHLPRALEACDLLEARWDQESCYGGAFMENVMNASHPHHPASELATAHRETAGDEPDTTAAAAGHEHGPGPEAVEAGLALEPFVPLKEDDPHYPCSIMDARYMRACYLMQTSAMLWLNGGDIGDAATSCDDAPESWRATCFQSLGRDISSYTLQDIDDSIRECRKSNPDYRVWCYIGLVKNFVDLTADTRSGFEFCREVEEDAKPRCYQALGEEIAVLESDPNNRRQLCMAAESPLLEQSCLYGAKVLPSRPPGT